MKYLLSTIALILCMTSAQGQILISLILGDDLNTGKIEFGLDGGLNYSTIRDLEGAEPVGYFNVGFYFDFKLKNPAWMIHSGVLVKSNMGAHEIPVYSLDNTELDEAFSDGSVERRINYFLAHVMIKKMMKNRFFWEVGVAPSLRSKAVDIFTTDKGGELTYTNDINEELRRDVVLNVVLR